MYAKPQHHGALLLLLLNQPKVHWSAEIIIQESRCGTLFFPGHTDRSRGGHLAVNNNNDDNGMSSVVVEGEEATVAILLGVV